MSLRGINNSKQNIFLFIIIFILFIVVVGLFFIQYKRSENLKRNH
jgi:CHASE3 domain sensor protein